MSRIPRIPAKKALVGALLIGVVGLGAGYALMQMNSDVPPPLPVPAPPAPSTTAAPAQLTVAEAKQRYDAESAKGSVSFETVKLLADAHVREQGAQAALDLYDSYLSTNPDNLPAIEARAEVLLGLGRDDEYKSVLMMLAEKDPTEARFLKLSGYLNGRKLYTEQLGVVEKLNVLTNKQNPEYMLAWVDVAIAAENREKAAEVMKEYQALANVKLDLDRAKQYTELLVLTGKKEDALNFAVQWTNTSGKEMANAKEVVPTLPAPTVADVASSAPVVAPAPPAPSTPPAPSAEPVAPAPPPPPSGDAGALPPPPPAPPPAGDVPPPPPAGAPDLPPPPPPPPSGVPAPVPPPVVVEETKMSAVVEQPTPTSAATPVAAPRDPVATLAEALLCQGAPAEALRYLEAVGVSVGSASNDVKKIYAESYMALNQHAKAVPLLKELRAAGITGVDESCFIALAQASKKDAALRPELKALVQEQFSGAGLNDAQKIDRVYALLNAGDKVSAVDLAERGLEASTEDYKPKWAQLHKSLTAPPPKRMASSSRKASVPAPSVSLDRRLSMATTGNVSEAFIRSTAFDALNAGRKNEAVKLFALLATRNGPESDDAKQLMYVLGARIGQSEMAWLTTAANQSSGADRAGWITLIANHAPAEGIVAAGEVNPQWLQVPAFNERYISSLHQLKQFERLERLGLSPAVVASGGVVAGSRLAFIHDAETAFTKARYRYAADALSRAIAAPSSAASATDAARENVAINYYSASLHHREGNMDEAIRGYENVLRASQGLLFEDRGTQVRLLASQMAIGDTDKARRGFETLLKDEGADESLLADYIAALLDQNMVDEARAVAQVYGGPIAARGRMQSTDDVVATPVTIAADAHGTISIPTSSLSVIQPMAGGRELRLQFRSPLPSGFAPEGAEGRPQWLSYLSTSYDSMVIGAASGYVLKTQPSEQMVTISAVAEDGTAPTLAPAASGTMTASEAARQRYLRLQLLYARTELESGDVDKALNRLSALDGEFSNASEYKAYQANAEFYATNPKRALSLIKEAQRQDPANEDIRRMRRDIERYHAEHLKLDHEWFKLGSSHQQITTLEARSQFDGGFEITARLQNNRIDTDLIRTAKGPIAEKTENKQRGELAFAKFMDDSTVFEGKLFGSNDSVGAGLSYHFPSALGVSTLYGEYHKPYWGMAEAVVADAVRDRVGIAHSWKPDSLWSVRAEGAYNRYSVENKSNIGDSLAAQFNVTHILDTANPRLALAYGVDAEYFNGTSKRGTYLGQRYKYLPLRSREVHSLSGIYSQRFGDDTNAELNGGYAVDRLGGNGPFVEGTLTHYLADDVDVQLRGRYGFDTSDAGGRASNADDVGDHNSANVGGYVRWTW